MKAAVIDPSATSGVGPTDGAGPTVDSTVRLALQRLVSWRHSAGYYEGFSDAGVAFDAADLVLARFVGDGWPEDAARVEAKTRHLLAGQDACGLFRLYPAGPCSVEATRIVCLAIDCVLKANGPTLSPSHREELSRASQTARAAIQSGHCPHFELAYIFFFRLMLEALNDNAPDEPRLFPAPRLVLLLPLMLAGLLPQATWRRTDRVLYPFIAVLPQLICFAAWRAVETSEAGNALSSALERLPGPIGQVRSKIGRATGRWLLRRQDSTGGFYYSALYTYLFVAAMRNVVDNANSTPLAAQAVPAEDRALAYVRQRETAVPTGISTSFVASDVWDTTAVATALLEATPEFQLSEVSPEALGNYVIRQQSPSGGFSYGRGSQFPDVDSTGLVLGLLASLVLRDPDSPERPARLAALSPARSISPREAPERPGRLQCLDDPSWRDAAANAVRVHLHSCSTFRRPTSPDG